MPVFPTIKTSPNDHRKYQYLQLDNELRVLLIEDQQALQAAASMAVLVGHFDDPVKRPGMAHFLEHMLFLGTEKYPNAGEYNAFINQHGGSNNAWTGTEQTNFFFTINADQFEESLDRFSQFFIAPKFDLELVNRERQAIESEFSLKLKDDIRRVYQVQKATVNQKHPFSKFSVGNLTTLAGNEQQIREELLDFYTNHYSANLMNLCIVAPQSLSTLSSWVTRYFKDIKNLQLKKHYPQTPFLTQAELKKKITIAPLKQQKRVSINFLLPALDPYYKRKPLTFISHLLGNECPGSLLSYLKQQGLANNLSAGGGVNGYNFKDYSVSIQLTDKGLNQLSEVVKCVFEFINLIKKDGLVTWRYQERANLLATAFRFQEVIKPMDLASHLSINMHHYDIEDAVFGDYRMDELRQDEVQSLLDLMTPENMRLQVVAKELYTSKQTDWYHTPYHVEDLANEDIKYWSMPTVRSELTLPAANPFIVADPQARNASSKGSVPQIVAQGDGYRIWHRKDDEFNVPKGHLFLSLDSEVSSSTPRNAALTRLYVEMLLDYLTESTYQAEVAGLNYNIYPHQGGMTLHLTGFTGNQEKLLMLIIKKARERNFTQKRFEIIRKQIIRSWQNAAQAKPISQLFTSLTVTLQKRSFEPSRMAEELEKIELQDLHQHVSDFYNQIYLEGLVYGDWLIEEAQDLGKKLEHILSLVTEPSQESSRELVNLYGKGTLLREVTTQHQDSAIIVYYQASDPSIDKMAIFSLLNHTMSSTFFHELRTKQQLGYMVGTGYLPLNRHPGMIFYVQSPSTGPLSLLRAIDEFIADFSYAVMQITNALWELTKQGLISQIMEHDANLKTRGQRYWVSIGNKDYHFDQRERVAERVEGLTRADLIKFMMKYMRSKHGDRLVLYSCGEHHGAEQLTSNNRITDLKRFKQDADKFDF